jgi:hypothetical protein
VAPFQVDSSALAQCSDSSPIRVLLDSLCVQGKVTGPGAAASPQGQAEFTPLLNLMGIKSAKVHKEKLLTESEYFFGCTVCLPFAITCGHSGVLPASKLTVAACATSSCSGTWPITRVTAKVTEGVICVFHAPVTPAPWI